MEVVIFVSAVLAAGFIYGYIKGVASNDLKKKDLITAGFWVLGLVLCAVIFFQIQQPTHTPAATRIDSRSTQTTAIDAPVPPDLQQWTRVTRVDQVSGQEMVIYSLRSRNSLSLSFPYQGRNFGHLSVRQHPRFGTNAYVTVEKGQIVCSYPTCAVDLRFDDGPVQSWQMSEPTDRSSTLLFFEDSERFIAAARQATQIFVELTFFQDGARTMRFEAQTPLVMSLQ